MTAWDDALKREMALVVIAPREERTMRELVASRQEEAILRCQLVAAKEREAAATARADYWESLVSGQAEIIRAIRKELLDAHDVAGRRAKIAAPQESTPQDWTRVGGGDRRRLGA